MEFKGVERSKNYSEGKSSGEVFRKAHQDDYLAGYKKAIEDSYADVMLATLKNIVKEYDLGIVSGIDVAKIRHLIFKIEENE